MKVEGILEEMENILLESGRVPFTNKRLVEEDDMARLLRKLMDAGVAVQSFDEEPLSLEEVFMRITKGIVS